MGRRLSDAEIVQLYRETQSSVDVSLAAGCSADTVLDIVRAAGEPVRPIGGGNKGRYKAYRLSDAEIVQRYRQGEGMPTIANLAGTNASQIRHILNRHKEPIRSSREANRLLAKKRPKRPKRP